MSDPGNHAIDETRQPASRQFDHMVRTLAAAEVAEVRRKTAVRAVAVPPEFDPRVVEDRPMVDHLRALAIFASVVRARSFRAAARELNLAPSVVSHHVSSLERTLRVSLLTRSTRKLSLTDEGRRLFEATDLALASTQAVFNEITRSGARPSGALRVSAPAGASGGPLIEHLAEFIGEYPDLRLHVSFTYGPEADSESPFDLELKICYVDHPGKRMKKLYSVPGGLYAAPSYLFSRPHPKHPADLESWDWIHFAPRPKAIQLAHRTLGHAVVVGDERVTVDSIQAAHKLALLGVGITRLPVFAASPSLQAGHLIELLPDWRAAPAGIYAVLPANLPRTGVVWKLIQFLVAKAAGGSLTT